MALKMDQVFLLVGQSLLFEHCISERFVYMLFLQRLL